MIVPDLYAIVCHIALAPSVILDLPLPIYLAHIPLSVVARRRSLNGVVNH